MGKLIADNIGVGSLGATTGQPTVLIPQQPFDRRVTLYVDTPGVFIKHQPLRLTTEGYQLPVGIDVVFDMPADEGLWAIASAGTVQVSRLITPLLESTQLRTVLEALAKKLGAPASAPAVSGVRYQPSALEKFRGVYQK